MPDDFDIHSFFDAVIRQDAERLRHFFEPDALIFWANANEQFTVGEYIRANCKYPGERSGGIEDFDIIKGYEKKIIFVARTRNSDGAEARTVSFIVFGDTENELIQYLTEYWSDIGEPPEWRKNLNIGIRYKDIWNFDR